MKTSIYAAAVILGLTGAVYAQPALEQLGAGRYAQVRVPAVSMAAAFTPKAAPGPYKATRANTVTIYFCGTGMTRDWWQAANAHSPDGANGYWSSELVASLFYEQETDANKLVVNGIGTDDAVGTAAYFARKPAEGLTGLNIGDKGLLDQGFPSSSLAKRGWAKCLNEAVAYLNSVLASTTGEITLNLVGHSRGGVLTLMTANKVKDEPRIKAINILALDPVPGDTSLPAATYALNDKVKNYVGIYSEDERTAMFEPVIPATAPGTKVWLLTLPGSHEAFTGNTQKDGHSRNNYFGEKIKDGDIHLPELQPVASLSKIIAAGLLASPDWGGVKFSGNRPGAGAAREELINAAREMRSAKAAGSYEYQRSVSYLPSLSPLYSTLVTFKNGEAHRLTYSDVRAGEQNGPRLANKLEGAALRAVALTEAVPGQRSPEQILNSLLEFGGLAD
ncbi:MAG: Mbeg1-like protein [Elusimicrobiota bacterium]